MALTADITAITKKYFEKKMYDNIFASTAALSRAKKKWYTKIGGGRAIDVPLLYATNAHSEWYSGTTLSVSTNSKKTSASFDWKRLHTPIVVDGLDELKNAGEEQVIDHVKTEVQIATKSQSDKVGDALFNAQQQQKSRACSLVALPRERAAVSQRQRIHGGRGKWIAQPLPSHSPRCRACLVTVLRTMTGPV